MSAALEKVSIIPEPQVPATVTPITMLAQLIERGGDINVIEKMMALSERWEANQNRKSFDEAIAAAKAEIPPILKTSKGHTGNYADFAAIARVVDPIISKHGLSYRFRTAQDSMIKVTCVLSHRAGHFEEHSLSGPADVGPGRNAIQAIGSTLTYLQRYSLVQALGLAATKDDDGAKAATVDTITQPQVEAIIEALEANNKDKAKFLKWAKIEKISDLPSANFQNCIDAINSKPVQP